jgi:hypothetical protein
MHVSFCPKMAFATWRVMHMDNKAAHNITKAKRLTWKVKHLEVCDAYICILKEQGAVKIIKVASKQNHLDIMTKGFGSPRDFVHEWNMLFGESSKSAGHFPSATLMLTLGPFFQFLMNFFMDSEMV